MIIAYPDWQDYDPEFHFEGVKVGIYKDELLLSETDFISYLKKRVMFIVCGIPIKRNKSKKFFRRVWSMDVLDKCLNCIP